MATANLLEDQITCSVCFDVYKNPHVLIECLHTFCLECIERLEIRNRIQCPECRQFSQRKDVKKDFKIQGIVDLFYKEKVVETSSLKCGLCLSLNKLVTFHCSECGKFLCDACQQKHAAKKTYSKHTVKSVSDVIKCSKKNFRELIDECEKEKQKIKKSYSDLDSHIDRVKKLERQQLEEVIQYTDDAIRSLKENQKRLENIITETYRTFTRNLKQNKELYEKCQAEIQKKIDFLNDLIKGQDANALMEFTENIKDSLKESIQKIKESLADIACDVQSPVTVKKDEHVDLKGFIKVQVHQREEKMPAMIPASYTSMYQNVYVQLELVDLDYYPRKLHNIKQDIWCCGGDKISVYTTHCQKVKEITHQQLNGITGLTLTHSDDIIVSCGYNKGLHQLNISGSYQRRIAEGSFSDVCTNGVELYALDYRNCILYICKDVYKWTHANKIVLHYNSGSAYDKLCVSKNCIYVSSENDKNIYKYNFNGQLQQEINDGGNEIHICGVDSSDNILITDYRNHQIKMCDKDGNWHVISIRERLYKPIHVITDAHGTLWVANFSNKTLLKCIVK